MKRKRIGKNVIFVDDIISTGRILFYFGRLFNVIMTLFCEQSRCWLTKNDGEKNRKKTILWQTNWRSALFLCKSMPWTTSIFCHCIIYAIVGHLWIDARRHFLWIIPYAVWICIFRCIFRSEVEKQSNHFLSTFSTCDHNHFSLCLSFSYLLWTICVPKWVSSVRHIENRRFRACVCSRISFIILSAASIRLHQIICLFWAVSMAHRW